MLNRSTYSCIAFVLLSLGAVAQNPGHEELRLSSKQQAIINRKIATLTSPADRHVAEGWSNEKKVAELLCRPAALFVLKKQNPDADRVFLGTDDPNTLHLESNRRLTGTGEFRTPKGWQDFSFTCELDPKTGTVTRFQPVSSSAKLSSSSPR